jgi:hypothetical protein
MIMEIKFGKLLKEVAEKHLSRNAIEKELKGFVGGAKHLRISAAVDKSAEEVAKAAVVKVSADELKKKADADAEKWKNVKEKAGDVAVKAAKAVAYAGAAAGIVAAADHMFGKELCSHFKLAVVSATPLLASMQAQCSANSQIYQNVMKLAVTLAAAPAAKAGLETARIFVSDSTLNKLKSGITDLFADVKLPKAEAVKVEEPKVETKPVVKPVAKHGDSDSDSDSESVKEFGKYDPDSKYYEGSGRKRTLKRKSKKSKKIRKSKKTLRK